MIVAILDNLWGKRYGNSKFKCYDEKLLHKLEDLMGIPHDTYEKLGEEFGEEYDGTIVFAMQDDDKFEYHNIRDIVEIINVKYRYCECMSIENILKFKMYDDIMYVSFNTESGYVSVSGDYSMFGYYYINSTSKCG